MLSSAEEIDVISQQCSRVSSIASLLRVGFFDMWKHARVPRGAVICLVANRIGLWEQHLGDIRFDGQSNVICRTPSVGLDEG